MTKRICLLAGFHAQGKIADYVLYYVRALAQLADVYYWADCTVAPEELAKLTPYVKGAWARRHGKYDFGSWQEIIRQLGWEKIAAYEECMFVNDSVFAPLFPLPPIVEKATAASCDAWALNSFEGQYFASFFFVFKKRALTNLRVQQFFDTIEPQPTPDAVIQKYEKPLVALLRQEGLNCAVWEDQISNVFDYWREAVKAGFPTLKIGVFTRDYYEPEWGTSWRAFLQKHTDYPLELIDKHLASLGVDMARFNSCGARVRSWRNTLRRWRKKVFSVHFCKGTRRVVLLGKTLLSNVPACPNPLARL